MDDREHMKRALGLAKRAHGRTSPNPMVGAILLKRGRVVAEDYHRRAGESHAEALVLLHAGRRAKGATLYVTLEPCPHTDKKTPPCVDNIIASGVSRVVVAMRDPNPKVSGRGISKLRRAGLQVQVGLLGPEALQLNEAYVKLITTGRPFVLLKAAMTLDGKIATPTGQSKWITGERARALVHRTRSRADAIITAVGTVRADDPSLTARSRGGNILKTPLRVIIDPDLKSPLKSKIFKTPPDTVIVTSYIGPKTEKLIKSGVKVLNYKGKLKLDWLLKKLGAWGVASVMLEGGSSLNSHALMSGVVDKVMFFVAPKIIGGQGSYPVVGGSDFLPLQRALVLKEMKVRRIGEDLLIEGYL